MADLRGQPVTVGEGSVYVVPRATVGCARRVDALGGTITNDTAVDVLLGQMVEVLSRNYPDITAETLADAIVVDELLDAHRRVMVAAGLRKAEAAAEGNALSP